MIVLPCEYNQEEEFVKNDKILSQLKDIPDRPLFLSSMAAKGLEFHRVWIYKFGDNCTDGFARTFSKEIPYDEQLKYEYFLNKLYVAVTRARKDLIIIDTEKGEQKLWSLTTKINIPENYEDKIESITYGNHYGLSEFGQSDPLEMARQLSQKDDPKLLRQARTFIAELAKKKMLYYMKQRHWNLKEILKKRWG